MDNKQEDIDEKVELIEADKCVSHPASTLPCNCGHKHKPVKYKALPVTRKMKVGRNDPCPCRSGKKYKKCCLN